MAPRSEATADAVAAQAGAGRGARDALVRVDEVLLTIRGPDADANAMLAELGGTALRWAQRHFGALQPTSTRFAWRLSDRFVVQSAAAGAEVRTLEVPRDTLSSVSDALLAHVATLWAEGGPSAALAGGDWLRVGATAYRHWLITRAVRETAQDELPRELSARYERYRRGAKGRSLSRPGPGRPEGLALALYCLDVELREVGSAFAEAHREAAAAGTLEAEAFRAAVERRSPGAASRLLRRVAYRGLVPLEGCLRRAGWHVVAEVGAGAEVRYALERAP